METFYEKCVSKKRTLPHPLLNAINLTKITDWDVNVQKQFDWTTDAF